MEHADEMIGSLEPARDAVGADLVRLKMSTLWYWVRSRSASNRSFFCSATTG